MTWTRLHPEAAPRSYKPAVTVSIGAREGRQRRRMTLTIRTGLLRSSTPGEPRSSAPSEIDDIAGTAAAQPGAWLVPGTAICIERGAGEHAGRLRLSPNGPWQLCKAAGSAEAASVILPPPAGAPADGCRRIPVAYRHGPGWIEVTLPGWALAAEPAKSQGDPREGSKPHGADPAAKRPYVGISDRVPDPAKAIQAASGHRVR